MPSNSYQSTMLPRDPTNGIRYPKPLFHVMLSRIGNKRSYKKIIPHRNGKATNPHSGTTTSGMFRMVFAQGIFYSNPEVHIFCISALFVSCTTSLVQNRLECTIHGPEHWPAAQKWKVKPRTIIEANLPWDYSCYLQVDFQVWYPDVRLALNEDIWDLHENQTKTEPWLMTRFPCKYGKNSLSITFKVRPRSVQFYTVWMFPHFNF